MIDAVNFVIDRLGLSPEEAFRMAALYPARAIGVDDRLGHLRPSAEASFVHLSGQRQVQSTWIAGTKVWGAD